MYGISITPEVALQSTFSRFFTTIARLEKVKSGRLSLRAFKVLCFSILAQHSGGLNLPTSIKNSNFFILLDRSLFSDMVTYVFVLLEVVIMEGLVCPYLK